MATINISGTNKLAERIIGEAEEEARAARQDADVSVKEIVRQSEKTISERRAELSAQRESAKKSLINGYLTRAALDGKKDALEKKRKVIDAAFSLAYDALLKLDAEKRKSICARLLAAEAEGGETVVPAKADRKAMEALVAALSQKHLTLSGNDANIDGGFLLLGKGYEKDCSFRSLLDALRDEEETAVYRLLFH